MLIFLVALFSGKTAGQEPGFELLFSRNALIDQEGVFGLSPACEETVMEMWNDMLQLKMTIDPSSKFYWMAHATGHGDMAMGLIDRCFDHGFEYCVATKPIDAAVQGLNFLLTQENPPTPYSGCCIPKECAYDERDARVRMAMCDPTAALIERIGSAVSGALDVEKILAENNISPEVVAPILASLEPKNFQISCGYGDYPITTGTYLVWALIAVLASLVVLASAGHYLRTLYCPDKEGSIRLPKVLQAFSFHSNWRMLTQRQERNTNFLDGIRSLSFCWVILGHTLLTGMMSLDNVQTLFDTSAKQWFITFVLTAFYSVDTFFWLGGFLFSYIFMRKLQKMRSPMKKTPFWASMIFVARWLRLTPVVMFGILLNWKIVPTFLNVTVPENLVDMIDQKNDQCGEYWWRHLLYITTYSKDNEGLQCMTHLWYLSSEFAMVWFTPLIFVGYLVQPAIAFFLTFCCGMVGVVSTLVVIQQNDIESTQNPDYMGKYYFKPWTRCGAYFVGFGFGLLCNWLEKNKGGKPKVSALFSTGMQMVSGGILLFIAMIQKTAYPKSVLHSVWSLNETAFFEALSRPGWAVGLSILTFSLMYGPQTGFIGRFLSLEMWAPIAKLSFAGYVIHMAPLEFQAMHSVLPTHFTPFWLFKDFIAQTILTLGLAFIMWFLVEAPFVTLSKELLKLISGGGKKKPKEPRASFKNVNAPRSSFRKLLEDDKRAPEQTSIAIGSSTTDQPEGPSFGRTISEV